MHTMIPHLVEASNDANTLPPNFDPQRFPILTVHWFGWRQPVLAEVVDLNLVRLAAALHQFGKTIGANAGSRTDMLRRLTPRTHEVQP